MALLGVRAPLSLSTLGGGKWYSKELRLLGFMPGNAVQRAIKIVLDPTTENAPDDANVLAPIRRLLGLATLKLTEVDFRARIAAGKKWRNDNPVCAVASGSEDKPADTLKRPPGTEKRGASTKKRVTPSAGGGLSAHVLPAEPGEHSARATPALGALAVRNPERTVTIVGVAAGPHDQVQVKLTPGRSRVRVQVTMSNPRDAPVTHGGSCDLMLHGNAGDVVCDTLGTKVQLRTDPIPLGGMSDGHFDYEGPDPHAPDPLHLISIRLTQPLAVADDSDGGWDDLA